MDANYNLNGLTERIKARLKDAQYSDSDIKQFINDAYFDILGETAYQFLEKHYRASTQLGGPLLLPRDFQSIILFTATLDGNKRALDYAPSHQFLTGNKNSAKNSYAYTIFGDELFYGLPDITDQEDEEGEEKFYTLDLFYLSRPKMLISPTDKPVIPYEYSEALTLGALARAEQLRDNFDYAQIYENKKEELITNMKERYCPRQQEGSNRSKLPVVQTLRH